MRLANEYDRIHGLGAELMCVSVDDDIRQAGMAERWGFTHTRFIADPGGTSVLQPLGLFDPLERDGIALPGVVLITPDGSEAFRHTGQDYADRLGDADLFEALEALGLPAVDPPAWTPDIEVPEDLRGFFAPKNLGAYFRGNFFGANAVEGRISDPEAKAIVRDHRRMAKATMDAWNQFR